MRRRTFVASLAVLAGSGVLTGCGDRPASDDTPSQKVMEPTAASLKAAASEVAARYGATQVGGVLVSAQNVQLLLADGAKGTAEDTVTGEVTDAFKRMKPTLLDSLPWDLLAQAVGTGQGWSGAVMPLANGHVVVGGSARTFLDGKPVAPLKRLTSAEGLASCWDEAMALTGGQLVQFAISDEKAAVSQAESPESVQYTRLASPGPYGLIDAISFAPTGIHVFRGKLPKLSGPDLASSLGKAMALRQAAWEGVHSIVLTSAGFDGLGIKDQPAIIAAQDEVSMDGVRLFLDPKLQASVDENEGFGLPDLNGKQAPTSLPGGWKLDDNYTIAPADLTMREANDTFMFSYRRGESVVSISFTPGMLNRKGEKYTQELAELVNPKQVGDWTVGTYSGVVPGAVRRFANRQILWGNVRPANPASEQDFISVLTEFVKAVS